MANTGTAVGGCFNVLRRGRDAIDSERAALRSLSLPSRRNASKWRPRGDAHPEYPQDDQDAPRSRTASTVVNRFHRRYLLEVGFPRM